MANDKKFVVKNGLQTQNVSFVDSTGNTITVSMLGTDTLSFSGDAGQLFSITDSLSGTIFSVNDISGVPSIEVDDDGTIRFAETFGNVLIGTAVDNGTNKLQVDGSIYTTSNLIVDGDLVINGTTTTVNTATLQVEDNNIVLNYGTGDTTSTANGAGITIQDAVNASTNATILWNTSTNQFDFSHGITATGYNKSNWDTAYGWGNHADAGYLTSVSAEINDLTAAVVWADVPDTNITQSSVTQHQAALSITESQISDLQAYATVEGLTKVGGAGTSYNSTTEGSQFTWYCSNTGSGLGNVWLKVADIVLPDEAYSACSFSATYLTGDNNYGNNDYLNRYENFISIVRDADATANSDTDAAFVRGRSDRIRVYKTATGVYELQAFHPSANSKFAVEVKVWTQKPGAIVPAFSAQAGTNTGGTAYTVALTSSNDSIKNYFGNTDISNLLIDGSTAISSGRQGTLTALYITSTADPIDGTLSFIPNSSIGDLGVRIQPNIIAPGGTTYQHWTDFRSNTGVPHNVRVGAILNVVNSVQINGTEVINSSGNWVGGGNISEFTNNSGYITGITSTDVTTALGYTPYQEDTGLSATSGTFTGDVVTDRIRDRSGSQLVIAAGESNQAIDGATSNLTAEAVYTVAEGGLVVISSPDNWSSDGGTTFYNQAAWDARNTATICGSNGQSSFPAQITVTGHGNSSQWNTAYGWGDHSTAGYLTTTGKAADSDKLDGIDSTSFLRSDTNDSFSGSLTGTAQTPLVFASGAEGSHYTPTEGGVGTARYWLRFDVTDDASYPFLTNRTPSGDVVIKTGTTAGGAEIERIRFKGGDGAQDIEISNARLGIGTTTVNKDLQVSFNNTDTTVTSGNGLAGGVAGDGLLIYNENTTAGVYANLDFRAGNADARIAYKYSGTTNVGDLHFITDNAGSPKSSLVIKDAGNINIPSGALEINDTTVVDASRNLNNLESVNLPYNKRVNFGDATNGQGYIRYGDFATASNYFTFGLSNGTSSSPNGVIYSLNGKNLLIVDGLNTKITFNGSLGSAAFTGPISAEGGNSADWNTAYTYSQVGHLPLSGGTLTGTLNGTVAIMSSRVQTNEIRCNTAQQLVLNAGESASYATGQAGEAVYLNAEGGIQINSSPNNWDNTGGTAWANRYTATICDNNGQSAFPGNVSVNGLLSATTKSFIIDHPTKEGMKLRYGSLEGPENGVYVRGKLEKGNVIELPDYWTGLVDESTITVQLTAVGKPKNLYVAKIENNTVIVKNASWFSNNTECFYTVYAERKDVEKLMVEY